MAHLSTPWLESAAGKCLPHLLCCAVLCCVVSCCFPPGVYNPRKLLGVTTLDVVRANTFVAQVSMHPHTASQHSTGRSDSCLPGQVLAAWQCCAVLSVDTSAARQAASRKQQMAPGCWGGHSVCAAAVSCPADCCSCDCDCDGCCCVCVLQAKGLDLKEVDVPVVGGHAGITILPLLSQVSRDLHEPCAGICVNPTDQAPNMINAAQNCQRVVCMQQPASWSTPGVQLRCFFSVQLTEPFAATAMLAVDHTVCPLCVSLSAADCSLGDLW